MNKLFEDADWKSVAEEPPQYYGLNLCYSNNPSLSVSMAVCWRASDGENEIYTIAGTDIIFNNVTHWMPLPNVPIKH